MNYTQTALLLLKKQRQIFFINLDVICLMKVPVAARSKAEVFSRSAAEIFFSNPTGGMDVRLL